MTGNAPVSLYIHVPFCSKKCPYCHFFVLPDSKKNQDFFIRNLLLEWTLKAPLLEGREIVSIYFGGGTPSLLSPKSTELILDRIGNGAFKISETCEITLEANPEKITKELMKEFKQAGINRVSVGIQSLDDSLLELLGRTHDNAVAKKAIHSVFESGIENISVDLMYELPNQTLSRWEQTVREATLLPISHLSLYNLTFEPGTSFYKKQKNLSKDLPSEEDSLEMLRFATESFGKAGLERYEISAFARNNKISLHNTGYWTGRPFLGLGPSAFSYFKGRRFRNPLSLTKWGEKIGNRLSPEDFEEALDFAAKQKELLALELRMLKGVDLSLFTQKNGPLREELKASIQTCTKKGYLGTDKNTLSLTEKGLLFYDTVAEELI